MCHSVLTYFIHEAFGDSSIVSQFRRQYVKDLLGGWLCLGETAVEKQVRIVVWTWMDQRDGSWWERVGHQHLKSSTHRVAICWLHGCLWKCFCEWLRKSRCPVQSKYGICGRRATAIKCSHSLSGVCYLQQIIQEHNVLSWPARPPGSQDHNIHNSCKSVDFESDIIFKHLSVSLFDLKSESKFKLEFNNSSNLSPQSEAL